MAIYHLSAKAISRATGRSTTAAAAYRAGARISDQRTGLVHDYTRKRGVMHSELILPGGGTAERSEFWNRLEAHHKRGDAVLAREVEVSLPVELSQEQRQELAIRFAHALADRYGVAADLALHAPRILTNRDFERDPDQHWEIDPKTGERHNGNWHAHIMLSACLVSSEGALGKKAVELDPIHCQRQKIENMADRERGRWCDMVNAAFVAHGQAIRVDHRSLKDQDIDRQPTRHFGPHAIGYEARTHKPSRLRIEALRAIDERLVRAQEFGEINRNSGELRQKIIILNLDISAAIAERDAERHRLEEINLRQKLEYEKRLELKKEITNFSALLLDHLMECNFEEESADEQEIERPKF